MNALARRSSVPTHNAGGAAAVHLLVFSIEAQSFAVRLEEIDRVIPAVELTSLHGLPKVVRGVFSLHGRIVPVADMRRRLGLPDREIALSDRIIVSRAVPSVLGLLIAGETSLIECGGGDIVGADPTANGASSSQRIARLPNGLALVESLLGFLSPAESRSLAEALHVGA